MTAIIYHLVFSLMKNWQMNAAGGTVCRQHLFPGHHRDSFNSIFFLSQRIIGKIINARITTGNL